MAFNTAETCAGSTSWYDHAWLIGFGGIGSSLLKTLSEVSTAVSVVDRDALKATVSGEQIRFWNIDAASQSAMTTFAAESSHVFGCPDALIVAAGKVLTAKLEDTNAADFDSLYEHNLRLVFISLQAFIAQIKPGRQKSAAIVIVSSNAGLVARPEQPVYAAMKAGVISFGRSMARALGAKQVRVNILAPGTVCVPRNEENLRRRLEQFPEDPGRPLGRIGFPEDLQSAVRFLLQPDSLITGHVLVVDGGSTL